MKQVKVVMCIFVMLCLWIISAASDRTDVHFDKARELLNAGKYVKAAEEFKAIVKLAPDGSKLEQNARYWVGQSYFRMRKFDEALSAFEKIIKDYPESALVSVTRVMMTRVREEKENEKFKARVGTTSDKGVIVDPKTGLKFTRILSDERLNLFSSNLGLVISPDGRFLFDRWGHWVIPVEEGGEPFELATEIFDEPIHGSWSPDMSKFAFISYRTGALFVMPVSPETGRATGKARKLVEGIKDESIKKSFIIPSWSPDGKRLAFPWWRNETFDIWTIPATGGKPTRITNAPRWERRPIWSPNGGRIIFGRKRNLTQDRIWDIWAVPVEGGKAEKILDNAFLDGFSPDGKLLAFHRDKVEGVGILQLSDKREFNITPPKEVVGEFSYEPKFTWSPEGNRLLFYNSGTEYWSMLGLVPVYGGPPVELGAGVRLGAWTQKWSPDGKFIITLDGEIEDLWIVPTDGGTPAKLEVETEPEIWKYTFRPFSPDLRKLAFLTEDRSLWVVPSSIEERRVTGPAVKIAEKFNQVQVGWSPDSKRIAFSSLKGGNADIWTASVEGGELRRLTNEPERETISGWSDRSAWSPDGKMIVYERAKALWVVPASGGKPREIVKEAFEPSWSPDGKKIGFLKRDFSFISIVTLATGEVRRIVDLQALNMVGPEARSSRCWGLVWSPDGKRLSFITMRRGISRLWVAPVAGDKPIELARADPDKWYQYWSPDGKKLSYNSDREVRVRMGAIWEVDVREFLSKMK